MNTVVKKHWTRHWSGGNLTEIFHGVLTFGVGNACGGIVPTISHTFIVKVMVNYFGRVHYRPIAVSTALTDFDAAEHVEHVEHLHR